MRVYVCLCVGQIRPFDSLSSRSPPTTLPECNMINNGQLHVTDCARQTQHKHINLIIYQLIYSERNPRGAFTTRHDAEGPTVADSGRNNGW